MRFSLRSSDRHPRSMGWLWQILAVDLFVLCCVNPAFASSPSRNPVSTDALAQLEQRANTANPREQCFLYAELVHAMTERAGQQIADGEEEEAAATLKKIAHYAHLIHMDLANDTKRLKDSQILMHHAVYELARYLHMLSADDQQTVQDTLKQLNQVNDELLTQVFRH